MLLLKAYQILGARAAAVEVRADNIGQLSDAAGVEMGISKLRTDVLPPTAGDGFVRTLLDSW